MKITITQNGAEQATASAETSTATPDANLDFAKSPGTWQSSKPNAPLLVPAKFGDLELPLWPTCADGSLTLAEELEGFHQFGGETICTTVDYPTDNGPLAVPVYTNEYWTAKQRQASSLHQISYRASFKAELPRFFIERLSRPGDIVLDPFGGRGTTAVESGLLGRVPYANDLNPVSWFFTSPRLHPPTWEELVGRLKEMNLNYQGEIREDLLAFYHPDTLREIHALRACFLARRLAGEFDHIDEWLCMVVMNRLTGQSDGFLSARTMPPTLAVSPKSQLRINTKNNQIPEKRDARAIILTKSLQLLSDVDAYVRQTLATASASKKLITGPAANMDEIPANTVDLVVTSPPFLNIVNYAKDNWLRCWFLDVDPASLQLTVTSRLDKWAEAMTGVLRELHRVLKPGGRMAFEVGEVRRGDIKLETTVLPCGVAAGLIPELVMIHVGDFTKNSHCWNVRNGIGGTNTNRIVVFRKDD